MIRHTLRKFFTDCSKCGGENLKGHLICNVCWKPASIEDIQQMSAFQIFGVDPNYEVDKEQIKHKFKELQQKLHPDQLEKLGDNKAVEKAKEVIQHVNEARDELMDDFRRGNLLLKSLGHKYVGDDAIMEDQSFTEEMFDLSDKIVESKDLKEVQSFKAKIEDKIEHFGEEVKNAFKKSEYGEAFEHLARKNVLKKKLAVAEDRIGELTGTR